MRTGDLRPETQRVQLGDALEGGMAMHVMATPHHLLSVGRKKVRRFANELVAGVMGPWVTEQALVDLRENGSERSHVLLPLIAQVKGDDAWEDEAQVDDDAQGDGLQNDARDEGCRSDAQGDDDARDEGCGNEAQVDDDARGSARQRGARDGGQDIDEAEEASQSADGESPGGEEAPGGT